MKVTIYRCWKRQRLWWDALDVIAALRAGGYLDAARALAKVYDQMREEDGM